MKVASASFVGHKSALSSKKTKKHLFLGVEYRLEMEEDLHLRRGKNCVGNITSKNYPENKFELLIHGHTTDWSRSVYFTAKLIIIMIRDDVCNG